MNNDTAKEIFSELFAHLERLETQSEALLQFMKEKKRVTDKQLAPYLEKAGNASNVRWRAARVRIERLLSQPAGEDRKDDAPTGKKHETETTAVTGKKPLQQAERTQNEPATGEPTKLAEAREAPSSESNRPAPEAETKPVAADRRPPGNEKSAAPDRKPNADEHQAAPAETAPTAAEAGKQASPAEKEQTSSGSEEAA